MSPSPHSPAERRRLTLEAFEAKVVILEEWAVLGVPKGEDYPRKHLALRRWRGPSYLDRDECDRPPPLGTWSDALIDRVEVGKYPHLAERFRKAIRNIKALSEKRSGRLAALEHALDLSETKVQNQLIQIAELLSKLNAMVADRDYWRDLARARGVKS